MSETLTWFFIFFQQEFRSGNKEAFQTLMGLSLAHFFGCYTPKQLADFLGIPPQRLYEKLKTFSLYSLKTMLLKFMVAQAVERLKPVLDKSPATRSRARITLSVDNTVIDRLGRLLRCTYHWYSGRWKKNRQRPGSVRHRADDRGGAYSPASAVLCQAGAGQYE